MALSEPKHIKMELKFYYFWTTLIDYVTWDRFLMKDDTFPKKQLSIEFSVAFSVSSCVLISRFPNINRLGSSKNTLFVLLILTFMKSLLQWTICYLFRYTIPRIFQLFCAIPDL